MPNEVLLTEAERLLAAGADVELRVRGESMRPFLRDGRDTVTLRRIAPQDVRRGQIVLFRDGTRWVLHRVREVRGERLTLAGDGNYRAVERGPRSAVLGAAVAVRRAGKVLRCGSVRWRLLGAYSLAVKRARTVYYDLRRSFGR